MSTETNARLVNILSIDAWADGEDGWTWNSWHKVGEVNRADIPDGEQETLTFMHAEGYTTSDDIKLAEVDDDGYNIVIRDRKDGRPLFAIEYASFDVVASGYEHGVLKAKP